MEPPPCPNVEETGIMDMTEDQAWDEGEKIFTQAFESLERWTNSAEEDSLDQKSKAKIIKLLSVIEDSKAEGSTALKQFVENNRSLLEKAKLQVTEVGKSFGSAVPGNMLENIDKLKDVLMGEDEESTARMGRAKHLASEGQDYLNELLTSEEAKDLETEGVAALSELRSTEEGKRIELAMSELLGVSLGTLPGEELSLETIKQKLLATDLETQLSNGLKAASVGLADTDLEQVSKDAMDKDQTGLLQKLSEGKSSQLAEEAEEKANLLLQQMGREDTVQDAKDAVTTFQTAAEQDVDTDSVAKNADEVLTTTAAMLTQAKKQRRGQRALSQSLEYLKEGMKRGLVQDAVKTFGSAEMIALSKEAYSTNDQETKDILLEKVRVASVEFLSNSLPNIEIPPISGFQDNVAYTIDGLDLSGFNIGPDAIHIVPGDFSSDTWDGEVLKLTCKGISAKVNELTWSYRQGYFPYLSGSGVADCSIEGLNIELGFKLVRRSPTALDQKEAVEILNNTTTDNQEKDNNNNAKDEKEQKTIGEQKEDYPVHLVLASKHFEVEHLELTIAGSTITWVYNMLLGLFADVVRDYIVTNVLDSLEEETDVWLDKLNDTADTVRLAVVLQNVFNVPTKGLEVVGPKIPREERENGMVLIQSDQSQGIEYDVHFLQKGPLGMRIGTDASNKDGRSIVTQFIKNGEGGVSLAEQSGKIQTGDIPIALNGKNIEGMSTSAIIGEMRLAGRPLKIKFKRIKESSKTSQGQQAVIEQVFGPGPLGLELTANTNIAGNVPRGAMIRRFKPLKDGKPGPAERCGTLKPSMILESCNAVDVLGLHFAKIMQMLKAAPRPIVLRFRHDPDVTVTFNKPGPLGLRLAMFDDVAIVTGFVTRQGPAERSRLVETGHVLHCIAGRPITTTASGGSLVRDRSYVENIDLLRKTTRPLILRFGPNTTTMDMSDNRVTEEEEKNANQEEEETGKNKKETKEENGSPTRNSSPRNSQNFSSPKKEKQKSLSWCDVSFNDGPLGITFCELPDSRTGVMKLPKLDGLAKTKGDIIRQGMAVLRVNGKSLEGLQLSEIIQILREATTPRILTFRDMELHSMIQKNIERRPSVVSER